MFKVRDQAGTERTVSRISVRDSANVMRVLAGVQVRNASGLHQVLTVAPVLSIDPGYATGTGNSKASITVTTNYVTVTAPAGSTYSWSFDDTGFTASAPHGASTAFSARVAPGVAIATNANCTVTTNGVNSTISVPVNISNNYAV